MSFGNDFFFKKTQKCKHTDILTVTFGFSQKFLHVVLARWHSSKVSYFIYTDSLALTYWLCSHVHLGTTKEAQQNKLLSLSAHYNGPPRYNNWRYSNHTLWYATHTYSWSEKQITREISKGFLDLEFSA